MGQLLAYLNQKDHLTTYWEGAFFFEKRVKKTGPAEIRTRITGFRVLGANHYTTGPSVLVVWPMLIISNWKKNLQTLRLYSYQLTDAVVAEWLRRLTRNQLRSPCTGSNPVNCAYFFFCKFLFFCHTLSKRKTPPVGLEPTIPGLGGQCLIH